MMRHVDAACAGKYSSAWTIIAAANVSGCPIQSVYPPMNGILDKTVGILNRTFQPISAAKTHDCITVMWTRTQLEFSGIWLPNHFLPLMNIDFPALHAQYRFSP